MPVFGNTGSEVLDVGGYCLNSTEVCRFGCCGDLTDQHCCFPIGVIIGCSVGVVGTIFLLISLFRLRCGNQTEQGTQQSGLHHSLGPEYGCPNPSVSAVTTNMATCPKCTLYPTMPTQPPSYEATMAGQVTDISTIRTI